MKKIFIIALSALCITSCTSMRLTGNYAEPHFFAETNLTYEEVWSRVIDYFALNAVPITTIDKSSGLIVSSKVSFRSNYTTEAKGKPVYPSAFVVVPVQYAYGLKIGKPIPPSDIIGDWNIRVKELDDRVVVNVNLMNLYCLDGRQVASTGVFEQGLIAYITKE